MTTANIEEMYPELFEETQINLNRFWNNYSQLGGSDTGWFSKNIGPLMMLPSCNSSGHVTYELKDKHGKWVGRVRSLSSGSLGTT